MAPAAAAILGPDWKRDRPRAVSHRMCLVLRRCVTAAREVRHTEAFFFLPCFMCLTIRVFTLVTRASKNCDRS